MMRVHALLLVVLLVVPLTAGCSLTLAGVTAMDEARSAREARMSQRAWAQAEPGTAVRVWLTGGETLEGALLGPRSADADTLVLGIGGVSVPVAVADVARVERARTQHSIWPALLLGGIVDVLLLAGLFTADIGPDLTLGTW